MQVFGSSCCVFVHIGSSTVGRMSHLNYLLPHCYYVHVWSQPSIDVQWVSCACNWLVFAGISGSKGLCNGKAYAMPCSGISCWALEPFKISRISTLATPIFVFMSQCRVKALLVLVWWSLLYILMLHLFLLGWRFLLLVLAICSGLIWVAWGSPATCLMCLALALELSIFLAGWCTLLAGNLSRSMVPSLIILETNSSSFRKNQQISLCSILAVSGGYLARLICAWTTLYHSSILLVPCLKLFNKSK